MPPKRKNPPPRKLTQRQLNFCQYVIDGIPQYEAYIKAGYSKNGARASSTALLAIPSIANHIATLRRISDQATVKTATEKRMILARDIDNPNLSAKDRHRAITIDNKMAGHDAPQVIEVRGSLIDQLRGG